MPKDRDENLDELLSALHDGELGAEQTRTLRSRIDNDPALRRRSAAFARVDEGLRGLASREVPDDLAARLRARIEAGEASPAHARRSGRARTVTPRRRSRVLAGWGVAAAAAGWVFYLSVQPSGAPDLRTTPSDLAQENPSAKSPTFEVEAFASPRSTEIASLPAEPVLEPLAEVAPVAESSGGVRDPFANASEEEIAIAFHYDTLSDFEMIQDMEMLELLALLDEGAPRG